MSKRTDDEVQRIAQAVHRDLGLDEALAKLKASGAAGEIFLTISIQHVAEDTGLYADTVTKRLKELGYKITPTFAATLKDEKANRPFAAIDSNFAQITRQHGSDVGNSQRGCILWIMIIILVVIVAVIVAAQS